MRKRTASILARSDADVKTTERIDSNSRKTHGNRREDADEKENNREEEEEEKRQQLTTETNAKKVTTTTTTTTTTTRTYGEFVDDTSVDAVGENAYDVHPAAPHTPRVGLRA